MIKNMIFVIGAILSIAATSSTSRAQAWGPQQYTEARRQNGFNSQRGNNGGGGRSTNTGGAASGGDAAIVNAANTRRNADFLEGSGMVVVQILPDDTQGLSHQKFFVQLSNGQRMLAVYNLDMGSCERIPVKVGDLVAMGGEFKWTNQGALLHWLHYDPTQQRRDGYVQLNGKDYCRTGARH